MRLVAVAVLAFASTALFAAPVPKKTAKEHKFEGTWKMTSCVAFDRVNSFDADPHWTFDAELNMTPHGGPGRPKTAAASFRLLLDSKADPKRVDLAFGGEKATRPGLYEFSDDGDTLQLGINMKTAERPKRVAAGENLYLWTLQRVKEGKK